MLAIVVVVVYLPSLMIYNFLSVNPIRRSTTETHDKEIKIYTVYIPKHRVSERQRQRQRDRARERQKQRETEAERDRERDRNRQKHTETETEIETDRKTERDGKRQ